MYLQIFPSGPLQTNAILFGCEETKKAAVVDPSLASTGPILWKAKELGLTIEKILLTHSHYDHIADVVLLKHKTGATIYVHSLDAPNLRHPGADGLKMPFEVEGIEPDQLIEDGATLEVGKLRIEVIHTPGHSPGCVCYYIPEEKVLFSGDTLFKGTYGAVHFPSSKPALMKNSLHKLGKLPSDTKVIPGHGRETTIENEAKIVR
jgi:hydroxyacylglutathione hydrolase